MDLTAPAEGFAPALTFRPLTPIPTSPDTGVVLPKVDDSGWDGTTESLAFAPITLLAELLRTHRVTARALTTFFLSRLRRFDDTLHCVVNLVPDAIALAEADRADAEIASGNYRGVLHGIPYGVKDTFATRDLPTTDGALPYTNRVLGYDAEAITRLRAAGAILIAKLSLGELAMDDVWYGGKTRNPWKTEQGSSGSSAGSGSAVAAGCVPFALGGETWGSIISPSRRNGVTGFRPTFGRATRTGVSALSWSMDKIGPMTRSVADCALVFDALRGADPADTFQQYAPFTCDLSTVDLADLRIGYDVAGWDAVRADEKQTGTLALYDAAKAELERSIGKSLTPVYLPPYTQEHRELPWTIINVEGATSYAGFIADGGLDALVQQGEHNWPTLLRQGQIVSAVHYLQAQRVRQQLQQAMEDALSEVDVYITPSCEGHSLLFTNLCGQPEIATRCGFRSEDDTPLTLSIVAQNFRDDAALRVAHAYEQATEWHKRTPPGF